MLKCLRDEYNHIVKRFDQGNLELLSDGWACLEKIHALEQEENEMVANLIELPIDPRPAIDVFIGYVGGKTTDTLELVHAGLHLAGYGLGLVHDCPPVVFETMMPDTIDGCARAIAGKLANRDYKAGPGDATAIDWMSLLPLVLKLIELFLKRK